nr:TPA_asm: hypothetical protein HUJ06_027500 [Nelumbo nucifera]
MGFLRLVAPKALRAPSIFNGLPSGFPRNETVSIRAYSATMSPPSKAVVYEQHGSPDQVTR